MVKIAIVMGSDSDLPIMTQAKEVLSELGVESSISIVSAHRTPNRLYQFATSAVDQGIRVIIAGAGGAAHLPGMVAALTPLPVIGVPISATKMDGLDALHSIVQMPAGVPVATVAIDGAKNAGILAAQILGASDMRILDSVSQFKQAMCEASEAKATKLEQAS